MLALRGLWGLVLAVVVLAGASAGLVPEAHARSAAAAEPGEAASGEEIRPAEVRLHRHGVFWIRAELDGETPAQRARECAHELKGVLSNALPEGERDLVTVRAVSGSDQVALIVNGHVVLEIGPGDAAAAGEPSVMALARKMRIVLEDSLHEERDRSQLSGTVLSISLVVFFGVLLFLSLPKIGELKHQGEEWVREHHEKLPHIRLRKVELISVGALQNTLVLAVSGVARVLQLICIYAYIVVCLSLFDTTAPWVEQLNGLVLSPFTTLVDRLQQVFPTATLTAAILFLLFPAWRVTGQLARAVERGDVHLGWLPADRVRPTVQLFRMGMVIAAVLLLGPLVSDDETSLVARVGNGALWALTLGAVPVVLTMLWGVVVVFGNVYRPGGWVRVGEVVGQIESIELFFVVLRHPRREKSGATRYRIPHLWLAFSRVVLLPGRPKKSFEYPVARADWHEGLGARLVATLRALHTHGSVELDSMHPDHVVYRVELPDDHRVSREHCFAAFEGVVRKAAEASTESSASSAEPAAAVVPPVESKKDEPEKEG